MKIQAKHIPEEALIELVHRLQGIPVIVTGITPPYASRSNAVFLGDLSCFWRNVPEKVILAKLKKLINKGLIDGCYCGCSGQFTVVEKEK